MRAAVLLLTLLPAMVLRADDLPRDEVLISPRAVPTTEAALRKESPVALEVVLRALSDWTGGRYIVSASLLKKKVPLAFDSAPDREELVSRLTALLRAQGISVRPGPASFVTLGDDPLAPTRDSPDPALEVLRRQIRCVDTRCEVDGAVIDQILAGSVQLMRSARIVPSIKDGVPNGFKLYAIRPSSPLSLLGFQNGDTIVGVNGEKLLSPEQVLEVYTKLRGATTITVSLLRRGQPVELTYRIKR